MTLPNYFTIAIVILSALASLGLWIYYRFIKPKHTRERFAFVALSTFIYFLVTALTLLFSQRFAFDWVIQAVNSQFNLDITPYKENNQWINLAVFFGATAFLYFLINNLYAGWDGLKSTRQVDKEETKSKIRLYDDFWFYRKYRDELEIYKLTEKDKREVFSPIDEDTRPFYIKAATLLKLYDQQYDIDIEKDWHREHQAFISRYASNNGQIGVLCLNELPTDDMISKYIKQFHAEQFEKHIVIIEGKGKRRTIEQEGITIDIRYENELLDSLINFSDYKKFIYKIFNEKKLPNSNLVLADTYVPLSGEVKAIEKEHLKTKQKIKNVERYILHWVNNSKEKEHLVLLGDYGQGKTVLTQKIVKEILNNPNDYQRIPILIELRGISPRNDEGIDLLGRWANRHRCKAEALLELHKAGKLLIILDGFDEMDLVADTELLFNHFNEMWALAKYPNAKVIITGRPNLFSDDIERRDALGILPQRINLPYSKALALASMSTGQIKEVLRKVQSQTKNEILETLEATGAGSTFNELLVRPSTLYQLSTIWDNELAKHKDRLNSAVVIKHFLDKTYERQDSKDSNVLTAHERNYFMMGISVGMMLQNQYTNQIRFKDLEKLIKQLWENFPNKLAPYKDAQQGNTQKNFLKERLQENQNALDIVLRDVCAGGILVQDLSGRDTFRFSHKSYMEYLVSAFYVGFLLKKENDKNQLMVINSIAQTYKFKQIRLAPSKDVERFAAEQIIGNIEIKDKQGKTLPQQNNEKVYLKTIFKKVNPYWYGRLFPNATGWLTLHPMQKYLSWIFLTSLFTLLFIIKTDSEFIKQGLGWFNVLLSYMVYGLIFHYKFHLEEKKLESVVIPSSPFAVYMRLYGECCRILHQDKKPLQLSYFNLIKIPNDHLLYKSIVMNITNISIFIAVAGAVAVAVAGAGEVAGAVAVAVVGAVAGAVAVAVAVAVTVAGAVAGAGAGAVAGAVAGAGAVAVAVVGAGAVAGAVAVIFLFLSRNFKKLNELNKTA
jgi:hypothetical protein